MIGTAHLVGLRFLLDHGMGSKQAVIARTFVATMSKVLTWMGVMSSMLLIHVTGNRRIADVKKF